jgi:integrase
VTFNERADRWLRSHNGRPSTVIAQRNALLPARGQFGDRPIAAVRRSDIQNMVEAMKADGRKPNTIRLSVQVVGTVFREAVVDDLIAKSPVVKIDTPKATKRMTVPTREQVLALLEAADEWFRPGIILGAGLGLRQAEAAALTWDRVDFMKRTVKVDRQWARGGGFAPTKTEAGTRTVPMPAWALQELSRYSPASAPLARSFHAAAGM